MSYKQNPDYVPDYLVHYSLNVTFYFYVVFPTYVYGKVIVFKWPISYWTPNWSNFFLFRYLELKGKVLKAGGESAIARHTQKNKKVLVRDRLRMLLDDDDDYLELSPFAGLGLPYGDIPSAGCLTGTLLNHQAWEPFSTKPSIVMYKIFVFSYSSLKTSTQLLELLMKMH